MRTALLFMPLGMLSTLHARMKLLLVFLFLLAGATQAECQTIKVACVGNSVTFGAGLENREKDSYPSQLQDMLGDRYDVVNFGHNGATLLNKGFRPYTQQEAYKKAIRYAADMVIIHLGLNDTDPRAWPNYRDDFLKDYLSLIDSFKAANTNTKIFICRMTPIFDRHKRFISGTRDWYWMEQELIDQLPMLRNVELIDLYTSLHNRPDLFADALHPNKEGATIIATNIYSALTGNYGGLKMSPLYTDNMVLQRGAQVQISGVADVGEKITISFGGYRKETLTGSKGNWSFIVKGSEFPQKAFDLKVSSKRKTLIFKNVILGDVWICSGQSNMAFMIKESESSERDEQRTYASRKNNIRIFDMKPRWQTQSVVWESSVLDSLNRLQYYKDSRWENLHGHNVDMISAIALSFGRVLTDSLNVPIGLILNPVGGSTIESWIDRKTLEFEFPEILRDWRKNDLIMEWARERASLNIKTATNPLQRHPYEPAYLFESGIEPLNKFPIKGVIWYQGESNAHNVEAYKKLFPLFVKSWRTYWNDHLPFYYVQLSSIDRPSWPWFRETQRELAQSIDNINMTVSSDLGDSLDVHPRSKKEIGRRLAFSALHKTYKHQVIPSGPEVESAEFTPKEVYIHFRYADGLKSSDDKPLRTFEVANVDGLYFPAEAILENGRIKLWNDSVLYPGYVRYGWEPFSRGNLVNRLGFPASTFKIEKEKDKNMINWSRLPDLPIGSSNSPIGVSAAFAGVIDEVIVVAGGCNFPDKPATEGGTKKYYDCIYGLFPEGWRLIGRLPMELAYGASVTTPNGVVCIGGNNNQFSSNAVYMITLQKENAEIIKLPSLPVRMDNTSATYVGNHIYVAGGYQDGEPCNALYALDLNHLQTGWISLKNFPGAARVQPVLASQESDKDGVKLYLAGGFQPLGKDRMPMLPIDVLSYNVLKDTWQSETFLPHLADGANRTLTGGSAVAYGTDEILFMGGVNHDLFLEAIKRPIFIEEAKKANDLVRLEALKNDAVQYMCHPVDWYQFNTELLSYNTKTKVWKSLGNYEPVARAGAAALMTKDALVIINGELKPGIRTPSVHKATGILSQ